MKNRIRLLTYILAFIMPFILGCVIYASGPFEGKKLTLVRHDWVNTDDDIVYECSYAFEIPKIDDLEYNPDGKVKWHGKDYRIEIIYEVKSGDEVRQEVQISTSAGNVKGKNSYSANVAYINGNPGISQKEMENNGLKVVLKPADGESLVTHVSVGLGDSHTIGERDSVGIIAALAGTSPRLNWLGWADYKDTVLFIEETLAAIIIPAGDSIVHMISLAVGETVTIDKVVYDEINKTDIDFFNKSTINGR